MPITGSFFFFLGILCLAQCTATTTASSRDLQSDLLIRYHGGRIHIKVTAHDAELHPHVVSARLCSAVDLNIEEMGCRTPGFVVETLAVEDSPEKVKKSKFEARIPASGAGLSFVPIQVIKGWPLVYIEIEMRMKLPGTGWVGGSTTIRKVARIDKANTKAGRAFGMILPDDTIPWWQGYTGMAILGAFCVFMVIAFVQRKIAHTRKKIRTMRPYSSNGVYPFAGGTEKSTCEFRALYQAEARKERLCREDIETQVDMEKIAMENGMLARRDDDPFDWL